MIKEVLWWRCEEEGGGDEEECLWGIDSTQLARLPPAGGASRCKNKGRKREKEALTALFSDENQTLSVEEVGTTQIAV